MDRRERDREGSPQGERPKAEVAGRAVRLPQRRAPRIAVGVALVLGGLAGFLPVLGFWMIPLGLAVLAYDLPVAARLRRRLRAGRGRGDAD